MQARNRSLVLQILLRRENCTRTELSELTGLTQAAMTKIVGELVASGLVNERLGSTGRKGGRIIHLSINEDLCRVIAVKLARWSYDVAVFTLGGHCVESKYTKRSHDLGPKAVIENIKQQVNDYLQAYPNVMAIGMAVPGPYLRSEGRIALMSEFEGWSDIDIREEMESAFDLPVVIEHDAKAGALAEWTYGATNKEGARTLISLLASEGIGAGVIFDGEIMHGSDGVAGEVGHMSIDMDGPRCICGNKGCMEMYCSAIGFARSVRKDLPLHPESSLNGETKVTAEVTFEHMRRGDAYSVEKVKEVGRRMGCGIANMVYLFNPDEIIITDIMTGGEELLLEAAREEVRSRVLPALYKNLTIKMSDLKYDTILMGAAALATKKIFEDPRALYQQ